MLSTLLVLTGVFVADPTYLRCTFPEGVQVFVTADEPNSAVSVSIPASGYTAKFAATFTATEVRFGDRTLSYIVSRTDLSATRHINLLNETEKGQCKVEQAPKRAF